MRKLPSFDQEVNQVLDDVEQLKQAQFIGGDSWIFYRNQSANPVDLHISIPTSGNVKVYRIEFVPDNPELECAATLFMAESSVISYREQIVPTQGARHSWDIRYTALANNFLYDAKVQIKSTQQGTFTITQIA